MNRKERREIQKKFGSERAVAFEMSADWVDARIAEGHEPAAAIYALKVGMEAGSEDAAREALRDSTEEMS